MGVGRWVTSLLSTPLRLLLLLASGINPDSLTDRRWRSVYLGTEPSGGIPGRFAARLLLSGGAQTAQGCKWASSLGAYLKLVACLCSALVLTKTPSFEAPTPWWAYGPTEGVTPTRSPLCRLSGNGFSRTTMVKLHEQWLDTILVRGARGTGHA